MMETAYDPDRLRGLGDRIVESIDALGTCRSDDPAAAGAIRVLRLARRNLEDHWMPLVREIEASTAMTVWMSTRLGDPDRHGGAVWLRLRHAPAGGRIADPRAQRLIELFLDRPWFDEVDEMFHAARVIDQMRTVLADPQACLDVLADRAALMMLADWDLLPDDLVQSFVTAGLHDAIVDRPDRLGEGYAALVELTRYTNGVLDDGIRPGMARGVAVSMSGYITTLAPAIRQEGAYPVYVIDEARHLDVRLGTYDEVADLFGSLLRDERAQAALGLVLGGYATHVVSELGSELTTKPGLEHVAAITDLVADAALAEHAELVAAAAAASSRRRSIGDAIGFSVGAALTATGAGATAKVVADRAIAIATDAAAHVEPDRLPGAPIPARVYDVVTVATIATVVDHPAVRAGLGLGGVDERIWTELSTRLDVVDAAPDAHQHDHRLARLEHWIGAEVPPLAALLTAVRTSPGMHELTESRGATDPDED